MGVNIAHVFAAPVMWFYWYVYVSSDGTLPVLTTLQQRHLCNIFPYRSFMGSFYLTAHSAHPFR